MHDLRNRLNPSQAEAVSTTGGPLLVIAGAGSGKTRVIEYRVLNLVGNGARPESILLLTFTRKAAHEMLSRASRHDPRCKRVDGGTFHSFAFKTLARYATALGISRTFSILDEQDSEDALHKCASRLGYLEKGSHFPKKGTLRAIISMSVNKNRPIYDTIDKVYPHFLHLAKDMENLRKEYAAYKIRKNYLDYDDLLVYLKLLLEIDEMREKVSSRYEYIMVDEYQDTNSIQGDIACLLAKRHGNIMVVGDDGQSIYGFRGSYHQNIMEFPDRFPGCRIIKLEENYRSSQPILDVANAVLENMANKYSKCLVSMRKEEGERPKLVFFKNAYDEAEWVAGKIRQMRDEDLGLEHQAVLFRAAYCSIALQAELGKNAIPYQLFGGLKFYETSHVKDILSHLKVVINPKDEIAWHRLLMLVAGIGPKTADRLTEEILAYSNLADIAQRGFQQPEKGSKSSKGLVRLEAFLKKASEHKAISPISLYDMAFDYYLPLMKEKFDDWHIRINDLEALRQIASRYDSLEDLLADFAIEPPERGVRQVGPESKDDERPVTLSTIHSAKGLEWDTVFLIGMIDGILPSSFALNSEEEIEEESRLFYVGITRAKNKLFLLVNHEGARGGVAQFNKLSRFLDAPNVLDKLDKEAIFENGHQDIIDIDEIDNVRAFYDKDSLLREVIGYDE